MKTNIHSILAAYIRTISTTDSATGKTVTKYADPTLKQADFSSKDNAAAYKRIMIDCTAAVTAVQLAADCDVNKAADKAAAAIQKAYDFLGKYEGVPSIKATRTDAKRIAAESLGKMRINQADGKYMGGKSAAVAATQRMIERAAYLHLNNLPWPQTVRNESAAKAMQKAAEADKRAAEVAKAKAEAEKKKAAEEKAAAKRGEAFSKKVRKSAKDKAAAATAAKAKATANAVGEVTTLDGKRKAATKAASAPSAAAVAAEKAATAAVLHEIQNNRTAATAATV